MATDKEDEFWQLKVIEMGACVGYLHALVTGADHEIYRIGEGASVDDGWRVTVDDGNGGTASGEFYPRSDIAVLAAHLGDPAIAPGGVAV